MPYPDTLADLTSPPLTKKEVNDMNENVLIGASAGGSLAATTTWTFAHRKTGGWRFWTGVVASCYALLYCALVALSIASTITESEEAEQKKRQEAPPHPQPVAPQS